MEPGQGGIINAKGENLVFHRWRASEASGALETSGLSWGSLPGLIVPPNEVVNCLGLEIGTTWYLRAVVFTDFAYATNLCDGVASGGQTIGASA